MTAPRTNGRARPGSGAGYVGLAAHGPRLDSLSEVIREAGLPPSYVGVAEAVHEPLAGWIARHRARKDRCLLGGICGPQGSGKSTSVLMLGRLLEARGLRVAILSLDDLYLPRGERSRLAAEVHPLLATRGPPGTHDVALGTAVLEALRRGRSLPLPRFDKATDERRPAVQWPRFTGPADVVLFEGWCVGARPQPEAELAAPVNDLERIEDADGRWRTYVNGALADYQPLFGMVDLLIQLAPPGFEVVAGWRREQEAKLRTRTGGEQGGGQVMTDDQIDRFVAHYERITRHMLQETPERADALVRLGPARELLELRFRIED